MFSQIAPLSLLLASSTLLAQTTAFPSFTSSTVAYLTNCQTSDTLADYSEVSIYADVDQSFAGQGPDTYADTFLGSWAAWEGNTLSWLYSGLDPNQQDSFDTLINADAQDPAVGTHTKVGCGAYTEGFSDGAAILVSWNCFKDQPRVLYTTNDHECSTVYYCRITQDHCVIPPPAAAKIVEQAKDL